MLDSEKEQQNKDFESLLNTIDRIDNPLMLKRATHEMEFHITKDQYLGDIKEELLKNCNHITLIEAGAGVGKTEMVKSIAREGKRVMMVIMCFIMILVIFKLVRYSSQ